MIVEPAPAKINLALHVRRRRPDGYHDLETLFAFAQEGDEVAIGITAADGFTITGPFAAVLGSLDDQAGNLVLKARDAFRDRFAVSARHAITLDKRLPVASGIGGGSADAAATLRALGRLHGVAANDAGLVAIAATLGADVPACLLGRPAFGSGKGDVLAPLAGLAGTPLLLVNPGVGVSTAAVFERWDGIDRGPIPAGDLLERARLGRNDLEPAALGVAPVIAEVRALLDAASGVTLARMSGSGATCFALFDDIAARDAARDAAAARRWWVLATMIG